MSDEGLSDEGLSDEGLSDEGLSDRRSDICCMYKYCMYVQWINFALRPVAAAAFPFPFLPPPFSLWLRYNTTVEVENIQPWILYVVFSVEII